MIEHWDGTAWTVQSSPNVGSGYNYLFAVSATSPTNAWTVGSHSSSNGATDRTLIEHWDGDAWMVQPSANVGVESNTLSDVVTTSTANAWAVGGYNHGTSFRALIEHWNGTAWAVQPSPKIQGSILVGVTAISATNAWAVGRKPDGALVEHWNGTAWKVVSRPKLQSQNGTPFNVDATSVRNVWAVGERYDATSRALRTFAMHCC